MARPIAGTFHHIHTAIGGELLKLEEHARTVDPNSPESIGGFAGHFGMLGTIQDTHSHEEESGLWPQIETRMPGSTATFLADHDTERRYTAEITSAIAELQSVSGDKQAAAQRLYRFSVALSAHLTHHMAKEEEQLYGPFAESLTAAEEAQIIYDTYEALPEQVVVQAMPWWASYQTPADIVEEAETLLGAARPEKARLIIGTVLKSLPPEKWESVKELKPSLAEFRPA